jgi:hypothetical protein
MAHYAFLDKNNIVTEVITGRDETEVVDGITDWEAYYGNLRGQVCKRTSFNGRIRKNYAGIGSIYDPIDDCFLPAKFYPKNTLNSAGSITPDTITEA